MTAFFHHKSDVCVSLIQLPCLLGRTHGLEDVAVSLHPSIGPGVRSPADRILATDGVEQIELTAPRTAVTQQGARTEIISISDGKIQAMNHDMEPAVRSLIQDVVRAGKPVGQSVVVIST